MHPGAQGENHNPVEAREAFTKGVTKMLLMF